MLLHSSFEDMPDKLFLMASWETRIRFNFPLGHFLLQWFYFLVSVEKQIFCLPLSVLNPGSLLMQWDDIVHMKNAERSGMTALLTGLSLSLFSCLRRFSLCVALSLLTLLGTFSWLGITACPSSGACSWSLTSGQPFYGIHWTEEELACLAAGIQASQLVQSTFSYKAFCRIC